jgi:hypothetical protein
LGRRLTTRPAGRGVRRGRLRRHEVAFERWHAFSLAPAREALIEMEAVYRGRCIERDSSVSWNVEPVTFSILGVTREDFVPVGVEVRFVGTGCPPT